MDKKYALECARLFAELASRNMNVEQVILFGSYARGTATEWSDIDVAVVASSTTEDWLDASALLFRLGRDIDLSIEPVLIDPSSDRSGFLAEIRRTGEVIYERGRS